MRVRPNHLHCITVALLAAFAMSAAMDVSARVVRVASGDTFDDFTGEAWPDRTSVDDPANTTFPITIDLGFALNWGQAAFDPTVGGQIHLYESGYMSFGTGLVDPGAEGTPPVIADKVATPFYLKDPASLFRMEYATGIVDPTQPYVESEAVPAFRATWFAGDVNSNFPFQLVLLDRSGSTPNGTGVAGDFDMEFNYGGFEDQAPPLGLFLTAGFTLGANTAVLDSSKLTSAFNYTYEFRNGVGTLKTDTVTPIPEPNSLALVIAGLLLLGAAQWWRRASQPAR